MTSFENCLGIESASNSGKHDRWEKQVEIAITALDWPVVSSFLKETRHTSTIEPRTSIYFLLLSSHRNPLSTCQDVTFQETPGQVLRM